MGGGNEPEAAYGYDQESSNNSALVSQAAGQPTGGHGHQEIAEVVGELHPGGLGLREAEFLLEMFVHDVDHSVAESPKEEKGADEDEGERQVFSIFGDE